MRRIIKKTFLILLSFKNLDQLLIRKFRNFFLFNSVILLKGICLFNIFFASNNSEDFRNTLVLFELFFILKFVPLMQH